MKETLISKLLEYISSNNPELLLQLEQDGAVTEYLLNKISSIESLIMHYKGQPENVIEEACMNALTTDLRPSKFSYVKNILEEQFKPAYEQWTSAGVLELEIVNLIKLCNPVFNDCRFCEENENNRFLKYCIIGTIGEYVQEDVRVSEK